MNDTKQNLSDSSSLQQQVEELQERATKDALSGLLNRGTSEIYINQRLNTMAADETCALLIVDLDNFKKVNDTLGHQAGDQAIRQAGRILSGLFRAADIVGRLGGDEFVVFFSGNITSALIRSKGQEICQRLQLTLGGAPSLTITASVGIYLAAGRNQTFDRLYQSADLALYKAKKAGKHCFYVKFSEDIPGDHADNIFPVSIIPLTGLLEYINCGVALLEMGDPDQLIYVSPSFCKILGTNPQKFSLPCPLTQIVHPDDRIAFEQDLKGCLSGDGSVDCIHRVSMDGASWRWWRIHATHIEYSCLSPVMLITAVDVTEFKENERKLQEADERLQSAFEQSAKDVWEVDVPSQTFTLYHYSSASGAAEPIRGKFPNILFGEELIHPSSADRFRTFAQELLDGRMQGYGNFIVRYQDTGCYGWATLSYRRLTEESGFPNKVVGIVEKLPQNFSGADVQAVPKRELPDVLNSYITAVLHADLSRDSVRELWIEGKELSGSASASSCEEILHQEGEKIFPVDDRRSLQKYYDRESLLELYAQGERWMCLEYRRADRSGSIRWVSHVINLTEDPLTRDIYLFTYLIQADIPHLREQKLSIDIQRDETTGLYDRATTCALIKQELQKDRCRPFAVAIVYLEGLDRLCTEEAWKKRSGCRRVANAISLALGPQCIVGQYSRDKLLVFLNEIASQEAVKHTFETVFAFTRRSLADTLDMDELRFIAEVSVLQTGSTDFLAAVSECCQLCETWHSAASDLVAFSQEYSNSDWIESEYSDPDDQVAVRQPQEKRPLSSEEKEAAFQCMSAMLSSDSLESTIHGVLAAIGEYYQADRVYILALTENRHVVIMPHEWTRPQKTSIQITMSGLLVERFPMLKRCMEERAPVLLTRNHPIHSLFWKPEKEVWRHTTYPIMDNQEVVGFVCVENPHKHPTDVELFDTIVPYLLRERKRFGTKAEENSVKDFLSGLPNLRSYTNVIYTLTSDMYSSLGGVCLEIPGLAAINSSQGFEYGSKLLRFVSKTMADIFGRTYLFRTWDSEFVALCPDTTRAVFVGRCTRLRSILQRRYPKDFRLGYAWSDGVFSGKELVNEARSIMRCEQVSAVSEPATLNLGGSLHSAEEAVQLGRFTVYFQPKVRMETGALIGAEALVRGLDEKGNIVPPDRFIGKLEENGDIRNLDFYVLDRTLAMMDQWRQAGKKLFPVSVNFSRFTLFDPSAPASVLAIQSRYPQLSPDLLEVEVTESAGSVDSRTLSERMDRFRAFGVHFALDDFGSKYANISIFTHVKFDCVKLDRTLIADLASNTRSQMLVRDLVEICNASGMTCVAEGVETQAQVDELSKAGCAYAQGFRFDRPLSAEAFAKKYLELSAPIQAS